MHFKSCPCATPLNMMVKSNFLHILLASLNLSLDKPEWRTLELCKLISLHTMNTIRRQLEKRNIQSVLHFRGRIALCVCSGDLLILTVCPFALKKYVLKKSSRFLDYNSGQVTGIVKMFLSFHCWSLHVIWMLRLLTD